MLLSTQSRFAAPPVPVPEPLLRGVQRATGLDLSGYRRSSLVRRLTVRMQQVGMGDMGDYVAFCESAPEEYTLLARTILIHVTGFFRDPSVWDSVKMQVVLRMSPREPVRIWCAGCASGEEAYTMAMVLAEVVGPERLAACVSLRATDVSAAVLDRARRGVYADAQMAGVPPGLRNAYFARTPDGWEVCPALRQAVQFERHDLTRDPAPLDLDLISCRNTLMYFEPALQARVLTGLAGALRPNGCLVLGRAEGIHPSIAPFTPLDRNQRLFTRQPGKKGMVRADNSWLGGNDAWLGEKVPWT